MAAVWAAQTASASCSTQPGRGGRRRRRRSRRRGWTRPGRWRGPWRWWRPRRGPGRRGRGGAGDGARGASGSGAGRDGGEGPGNGTRGGGAGRGGARRGGVGGHGRLVPRSCSRGREMSMRIYSSLNDWESMPRPHLRGSPGREDDRGAAGDGRRPRRRLGELIAPAVFRGSIATGNVMRVRSLREECPVLRFPALPSSPGLSWRGVR